MDFSTYNDIVRQWVNGVLEHRRRDAELTLKYVNDIIEYGNRIKDNRLLGFGYFHLAETYYCLNDGDNFFAIVPKAIEYLEKVKEWEYIARCYNILGIIAANRGNLPIAYDYYLNGLVYCDKFDLPDVELIINNNCGALCIQSKRYNEALGYLQAGLDYILQNPDSPEFNTRMVCIYQNIALCRVLQGKFDGVADIFEKIKRDHWDYTDYLDKIGCLITEAIFYHKSGQSEKRDECIEQIDAGVTENIAFLDMLDDYFSYAEMLLECDKDDEFWHIIDTLDPMIRSFKITNMQLKAISLKIKYYRKHSQSAEFLQAAGLYYELSVRREEETNSMMSNVISLRNSLEAANKERQEMEQENIQLAEKSERDPLTRLANRGKLKKDAEEIYARALVEKVPIAIEILDIDYFKEYNDNYGHQAGDTCLKEIAECLEKSAKANNGVCARYGGDEFVLVYYNANSLQATEYAQELKESVLEKNIPHRFSKVIPIVSISQGVCSDIPTAEATVWDFLSSADNMLYKIKKQSRNNFCVGDSYGNVFGFSGV